ncbi:carnitine transporter [Clostridia bacterium]|nr:carnitine transporter [Clostridia bacterium]
MIKEKSTMKGKIDWAVTIIPLCVIVVLGIFFAFIPEQSQWVLSSLRSFLGDEFGIYYLFLGVAFFLISLYLAFSRYGKIRLGKGEKPLYRSFSWGSMIFTSTMAADILFYSLCEWALYAGEEHVQGLDSLDLWAETFSLFHWGPIAWSFYIVMAVAFGFMLHVSRRGKQKFSEACRPVLGKQVDSIGGKCIDLIAVFSLLAGTATTFSLATPLLSEALAKVFSLPVGTGLTVCILLLTAFVYIAIVWTGMKGIEKLANFCLIMFFSLLFYVFFLGGETRYILENGFSALGNMVQNFIHLSTWIDPMRKTSFPQNWTVYYWAYWMVWCVATPFFIGQISKGRTIKETVLGSYAWGLAGTFTSFIVLGNYGLAKQMKGSIDVVGQLAGGTSISKVIMSIFSTLPLPQLGLILLVISMISFYATTFDALTVVVSSYSYKLLKEDEIPDKKIRVFWAVLFILLPLALIFSESSLKQLQNLSIIAAFPIGLIMILIVVSFFKEAKKYLT